MVDDDTSDRPHLCFVASRRLQAALVDPLDVWTCGGQRIGSFDGVVVDPDEGRACYLVVDRGRFRPNRCLIPLPARLDVVHQALRVDADDVESAEWPAFDAITFPSLTGDHLPTAVLAQQP